MKELSSLALWPIMASIMAVPIAAQPVDPPPTFGEVVDVRVVNLEVVVTDGEERVSSLVSEDFRLLVDGEETPIEYFTEVQGGRALPSAELSGDAAIPALAPGEAVGTRYLVFIDDSSAIKPHRDLVLRNLADQLELLGPDDHMAVVAYDGRELEMLTSWTRSRHELTRVFDNAQERKAWGLLNQSWSTYTVGRFYWQDPDERLEAHTAARGTRSGFDGRARGFRVSSRSQRLIRAAASTLRGFARPPGRKVMLLLSRRWPTAREGDFSSTVDYGDWDMSRDIYRPLIDTANRLGYSLYPVDMKGLPSGVAGAQYATPEQAQRATARMQRRRWAEEGALSDVARETGGRRLIYGARLTALERTVDDTRSYYWLGFSPAWQANDERHKVKVEVLRKGLKVRSRRTFTDLSRQTETTMRIESALLFDLPLPGEDRPLGVTLGEPENRGSRRMIVPVRLEIPLDQVTLLPDQGGYVAQLELRVTATDDHGDQADIPVLPFALRRESPDQDEVAIHEVHLQLRRRSHELTVSVQDPASGNVLSKRLELTVGGKL